VDAALAQEEFDFVDAIAADYPINVLARLLDVPEEFTTQLVSWGNEIVGATDPDYARVLIDSPEAEQYAHLPFRSPASIEIFEYGRKLAAERKGRDGDDLVSRLMNRIPEDGVPLTPTDFDNYFLLLVVAGNLGSCHDGICGTCEQIVLDGEVDHRDSILTKDERALNETMMICMSRCRSKRLTLDL
jgi:cytochrome P450